jgi:hypothetical protein
MRFIVAFLARSTARNAMAFRYLGTEAPPSRPVRSRAANRSAPGARRRNFHYQRFYTTARRGSAYFCVA